MMHRISSHAMQPTHVYEVRPRKGHRGVDLISDACRSVACGMTGRMQSATQSATQTNTVDPMVL